MPKGLTRNDLLYILNEIFKISTANNNALRFTEQGLFVESYSVHSGNSDLHMPSKEAHDIVAGFSLDANDNLIYNGDPATIRISDEENNAIQLDADGALYVERVYNQSDFQDHLNDDDRHVTQEDRDKWDGMVDESNEYTDDEIEKIKIHRVVYSTSVPAPEDMDPHVMYILLDEENIVENPVIKIKVDNEVVTIGITKATMNLYYTKQECDDKFETIQHAENTYMEKPSNEDVITDIVNDNGHPVFTGKKFLSSRANNALREEADGSLFCEDFSALVHSLQISAAFSKTNLYDQEISAPGTYILKDDINSYNLLLVEYWFYPPAIIQVPVYAMKKLMHTATDFDGYSYTFTPDDTEFLYNKITDKRYSAGFANSEGKEWTCYYDYDDLRKQVIEINYGPDHGNVGTYGTGNYGYASLYSTEKYLEYEISFKIKFGTSNGGSISTNIRDRIEMLSICSFIDENNIEHEMAFICGKWYYGSDEYLGLTGLDVNNNYGHIRAHGYYLVIDPTFTSDLGNQITCKKYVQLSSYQDDGTSNGILEVKVIKTSNNVKIYYGVSGATPSEIVSLNFNRYAETDIFTNQPGKIGITLGRYFPINGYMKIYDINFTQHVWYQTEEPVVDRMDIVENPDHNIGYAKTAIVDTDNIEYLYRQSIGYTLELGYGISNSNIKFRMHENKLYVDHLSNSAIYRITGIGQGHTEEEEPDPNIFIYDDPEETEEP